MSAITNPEALARIAAQAPPVRDFWCDGHHIAARTAEKAAAECLALYGHAPEVVHPWTPDDQTEADRDDYTHHAGEPVTDPRGTVIDVDGESWTIGPDTDAWSYPLEAFDYRRVS